MTIKKDAEKNDTEKKEATTIKFMSHGSMPHEITIDTDKPVDEQLQSWARYYVNSCTYKGLIADYNKYIGEITSGQNENI